MNWQRSSSAVLISLALVSFGRAQTRASKFAACPVTIPRKTPDAFRNALGTHNSYWHGDLYCASLWPDATVPIGPKGAGAILPDGSLEMKYPWYRAAGLAGRLMITGRRLDAPAAPLRTDIPSGSSETGFQASELIFPTEGCWEITGKVGDKSLTFVNRVIRAD
jgi:hypothetical protein